MEAAEANQAGAQMQKLVFRIMRLDQPYATAYSLAASIRIPKNLDCGNLETAIQEALERLEREGLVRKAMGAGEKHRRGFNTPYELV